MSDPRAVRLLVWSLATFHSAFFFAVLVAVLYGNGSIGDLLASLNTLVGSAVYAVLWATTWWSTRQAWRALDWKDFAEPLDVTGLLGTATIYGGLNGMLFLGAIALVAVPAVLISIIVQTVASGRPEELAALVFGGFFVVLLFAIAEAVAFVVGAVVGLLFAVLDGLLIGAAWQVARWAQQP